MNTSVLQIMLAKGAGEATVKRFLTFAAAHDASSAASLLSSPSDLVHNLRITNSVADNIIASKIEAQLLNESLEKNSVFMLLQGTPDYPETMVEILEKQAPALLFCRGNRAILKEKFIGFCGSRHASEKGLQVTRECAMSLAKKNIGVVSGHASGVDMAAHCEVLENGGKTILVLPEGILKHKIKKSLEPLINHDNYLAVSQFSPHIPWSGRNAMQRNGLIIALSKAMILVESGMKGGTFEAGNETLRLKMPLFVIGYRSPGEAAQANPYFIANGGKPILRSSINHLPNLYELLKLVNKDHKKATVSDGLFNQPDIYMDQLLN